jgi:acyl-coenzyme A thioesterase PaaI-like protein
MTKKESAVREGRQRRHDLTEETEGLLAEGWRKIEPLAFSRAVGPYWRKGPAGAATFGLIAEQRHANGHMGTVHGGVIMSFADDALGATVTEAIGGANCVTLQLQLQFVAAGLVGDFISCQPEIIRRTSQIIFLRGLIVAGERTIASVEGIWKLVKPRPG